MDHGAVDLKRLSFWSFNGVMRGQVGAESSVWPGPLEYA